MGLSRLLEILFNGGEREEERLGVTFPGTVISSPATVNL